MIPVHFTDWSFLCIVHQYSHCQSIIYSRLHWES